MLVARAMPIRCGRCVDIGPHHKGPCTNKGSTEDAFAAPAVNPMDPSLSASDVWAMVANPAPEPPQAFLDMADAILAEPDVPAPTGPIVNPKELAGAKKPAVWNVVPRWVSLLVGRVMSVGAAKYGRFNYRDSTVSAMTYVDAIERHMQLWQDGEERDPESGVSHLAHVMAGCAILLDAQANGSMGDDRPKTGRARATLERLEGLLLSHPLPTPQS